ncbi:MAG: hypothetical protein JXM79_12830 [Sedimentisphaerales bacterium]|nr:hypothetical protein [Sedimentisphaerales bacterium]
MVNSKHRGRSLCLPWATPVSCPTIAVVALVVLSAAGGVWAQRQTKQRADGLMGSIPAESLFCVRINKIDDSLGAVNAYLKGIAPESFDAKAMVFSKLGGLLGDENLRGVNRNGNFALFAVIVPGESGGQNPMANLFMGALLPVRNYDNFIARNPNCGEADDQGVSTLTVEGRPQGLATRFRRFALLCPPHLREKLPQVKKMLAQRKNSLANSLNDDEKKFAASSSVWVYLNVKQGAPIIQPMLFGKLEQIKAELQKAKESGEAPMMIDPSGVVSFYSGIFKMLLGGTDRIAVALSPSSESCTLSFSLKPLPGTEMVDLVGQELGGSLDPMLGYLEDGAMMNMAAKIDHKSLTAAYTKFLDLFGNMAPGSISEDDLQAVKELTTKTIQAMGNSLAISAEVDTESGPFRAKYIIEVKDKEAFDQAIDTSLKMMEDGVFNKLYKGFGIEMDVEINRDAGTYKGNSIGGAIVTFKMGEDESMQGQMMAKMFGEGFKYRWAFVEKYFVYTVGADADQTLRALVDQVQAGGPKEIASEVKAALDAIDDSREADAVGTFNYVRAINLGLGFVLRAKDAGASTLNMPTKSNIAFACRTNDGKATLQIDLPKSHLQDIKKAFETLIPEIEKQHQK